MRIVAPMAAAFVPPERAPSPGRPGRFVREADMLEPLLAGVTSALSKSLGQPLFEVQTTQGIVDLLFVRPNKAAIEERVRDKLPPLTQIAQVAVMIALTELSAIKPHGQPADARTIARYTSLSSEHIRRNILPHLQASGWITSLRGGWQATRMYHPPVRGITAIEVKRGDWRRALAQAAAHTDFATTSYVALDETRIRDFSTATRAFELAEVGLLTISKERHDILPTGSVEVLIKSHRRRRPSPVPRAVVAERSWALIAEGRRSGHVGHVFGRYFTTTSGVDPRLS